MSEIIFYCASETKQYQLGELFAKMTVAHQPLVFLHGELGAGKTTFVRGVLQGFGYVGKVKSPTYSLMEIYQPKNRTILHVDLYRLIKAEEILAIGLAEQIHLASVCLIEWPEKAADLLPSPDLSCYIAPFAQGRQLRFQAHTPQGQTILSGMAHAWSE